MITIQCAKCGMLFGMTLDTVTRRQNDHESFYCPVGHGQAFTGKSAEEKFRDEVIDLRARLQRAEGELAKAKRRGGRRG